MLLWQNRLTESTTQSFEDLAEVEQIGNAAEISQDVLTWERRTVACNPLPVGPLRRYERAATVWQTHKKKQTAAPSSVADYR
jgi:hypothetical protein